jgi:cell division protein FtsL
MSNKRNGKKYRKKLFQREKTYWIIIVMILFAIPVANVYTKAILSETNIELEEAKNDVERQQNTNDSLRTEIYELASLDKIQLVAQEDGLQYNNENIIVVKDN